MTRRSPKGACFTTQGVFSDLDSTKWTAQVDYGDGAGFQSLLLNPITQKDDGDGYTLNSAGSFDLNHRYATAGLYDITVTVTDDSGATGLATLTLNVVPAPPTIDNTQVHITPTIVDQGQSVSLNGSFSDPSVADSHVLSIIWGDGSTSSTDPAAPDFDPLLSLDEVTQTFIGSHVYPFAAPSNTPSFVYPVQATVTDSTDLAGSTTSGLFFVQVDNVLPGNLMLNADVGLLDEGDANGLNIGGSFSDPGSNDTHRVEIDWGDGTEQTVVDLGPGVTTFSGVNHVYANDPDAPATSYSVTVSVADNHQPLEPVEGTISIQVADVAASNFTIASSQSTIDEGDSISLGGSFDDPGVLDRHDVSVDWGDGSSPAVIHLGPGVTSFDGLSHTYIDDPGLASDGSFTITATVTDPAEASGATALANTFVFVSNVAPSIIPGSLVLTDSDGIPIDPASGDVHEGDTVVLTGAYTDPGTVDRHTVTIDWNDGTTSSASVDAISRTFQATHRYLDNGLGGGSYAITATVTDNAGASSSSPDDEIALVVANVAPLASIRSLGLNQDNLPVLAADTSDVGPSDNLNLTYVWTIDGAFAGSAPTLTLPDPAGQSGPVSYGVTLTVTDPDSATTFANVLVTVLDPDTVTYEIPDPGDGFDSVIVIGNAQDNVIVAGSLTGGVLTIGDDGLPELDSSLDIPVQLDGASGIDTLIGGSAGDILYLHQGNDTGFGMDGDDSYLLTPNSTLTAIDGAGITR